jgi:hypothetical protein
VTRFVVAVLELVGVGAFLFGLWLAWEPLAFMVGGLLVVAVGLLLDSGEETAHDSESPG